MKIASEQDVGSQSAEVLLHQQIKALSANLLHVIGGAGRVSELPRQIMELADTLSGLRQALGREPTEDDFRNAIGVSANAGDPFDIATIKMVHGSLEIAASRILAQEAAEITGKMRLFEGILCRGRAMKSFLRDLQS
ncbi:MAG: hypothetical protein APF78_08050 [Sphingomonadales bacterium BRH_c3]|nr:MAG: hypothetical protein APF78_08050 [Sphingomonadales bacterium BRH_c3]